MLETGEEPRWKTGSEVLCTRNAATKVGPEQLQSRLKAKSWGSKQLLKTVTKTSENEEPTLKEQKQVRQPVAERKTCRRHTEKLEKPWMNGPTRASWATT